MNNYKFTKDMLDDVRTSSQQRSYLSTYIEWSVATVNHPFIGWKSSNSAGNPKLAGFLKLLGS